MKLSRRSPNLPLHLWLAAAFLTPLPMAQAQSNLVVNGSFEQPVRATNVMFSSELGFFGWFGYSPASGTAGIAVDTNYGLAAIDGRQCFLFNSQSAPPGTYISQTLATIPGVQYRLAFSVGRDNGFPEQPLKVKVQLSSSALLATLEVAPPSNIGWLTTNLDFTAVSGYTSLSFTDASGPNPDTDLFLDAISVTPTYSVPLLLSLTSRDVGRTPAPGRYLISAWGDNSYGQTVIPSGLTNAVAVEAGMNHCLALKADGTVVAWGDNSYGQTNVPAGLSNVIAISAGGSSYHNLALKSDGTVVTWGETSYQVANIPANLSDVIAISANYHHSLALKRDGTVVQWGTGYPGEAPVPAGLSNVVAIAAGKAGSGAVKTDGTVVVWGSTTLVPDDATNVVAIAAGDYHAVALRRDGTVSFWGVRQGQPLPPPQGWDNVVKVSCGRYCTFAIKSDGSLSPYGTYYDGIPSGTQPAAHVPAGLSGFVACASGARHTVGLHQTEQILRPTLCFDTLPYGSYQLQYSSSLATGQWFPIGNPITGDGARHCVDDPATRQIPEVYYRVAWTY